MNQSSKAKWDACRSLARNLWPAMANLTVCESAWFFTRKAMTYQVVFRPTNLHLRWLWGIHGIKSQAKKQWAKSYSSYVKALIYNAEKGLGCKSRQRGSCKRSGSLWELFCWLCGRVFESLWPKGLKKWCLLRQASQLLILRVRDSNKTLSQMHNSLIIHIQPFVLWMIPWIMQLVVL